MTRALLFALLMLATPVVLAFPWDKDMQDQPSVKPQETEVPLAPEGSVPASGAEPVEITQEVAAILRGRIESAQLPNPVPADEASIARGKLRFETHCAVCHGKNGAGDGPVGQKFIARPFDLRIDYVQNKPDGELFFTITNGGIAMPFYRDALSPEERWDVVNYLKQGLSRSDQP
ncbi:MAG: cytochrome c [Xanthomonadales bacterium]|nr:cytochrome c [Xanthomonadales bacterium]